MIRIDHIIKKTFTVLVITVRCFLRINAIYLPDNYRYILYIMSYKGFQTIEHKHHYARDGRDGRDADPVAIRAEVARIVGRLPLQKGEAGKIWKWMP